jgi:RimJ/RimL family protein N-acetyltransferase
MDQLHDFSKMNGVDRIIYFQIVKPSDGLFSWVETAFTDRISALYAHRCTTLQKLQQHGDRYCEIMLVNQQPAGFLIYKKELQHEFGLKNAFELKTLFVFDPEKHTRRGLGSLLFDRAAVLAQEKQATCIYSTVVEDNVAMVACAIRNGFHVELHGRILTKRQRKYYPLEENEVLIIKYS